MGFLDSLGAASSNVVAAERNDSGGGGRNPSQIYANILREQEADYLQRWQFFEDRAFDDVLDPGRSGQIRDNALGYATDSVNSSFDRAASRSETLRSRYNQDQTPGSKAIQTRQDAIARASTLATARNSTREFVRERENSLLSGNQNTATGTLGRV